MKKENYFVEGMHCKSCELYIESQFKDIKGIKNIKSNSKDLSLEFEIEDTVNTSEVIKKINEKISGSGYNIKTKVLSKERNLKNIPLAILLSTLLLLLFVLLQKIGIGNNLFSENISYPSVFVIGIVASISSCMAVVGSLVLSISSVYAKEGSTLKPILIFHISRIIGFFLLGGLLGYLGSLFIISKEIEIVIGIALFLFMLILGINLLDITDIFKKFEITLPKSISKNLFSGNVVNNILAPVIIGIGSFFLPCGFTQSMQLNSVISGNFIDGALIMFIFSLGTLPVLLLISFGAKRISKSKNSDLYFKISGLLVILFAIYNFLGTLVANGVIPPIF